MQQQSLKVGPGGGGRKFNKTLKDLYYINIDKMHTEFDAPRVFLIFNTYFFKANNIANFRPDFCKSPPRGERVRMRRRSKSLFHVQASRLLCKKSATLIFAKKRRRKEKEGIKKEEEEVALRMIIFGHFRTRGVTEKEKNKENGHGIRTENFF